MTERQLDRETVLEKLFELKNQHKTASFFAISKETLKRRLNEWGVTVDFAGKNHPNVGRVPTRGPMPALPVGSFAIWKPVTARAGYFGLPIATASIRVKTLTTRNDRGSYSVWPTEAKDLRELNRNQFNVHENALTPTT